MDSPDELAWAVRIAITASAAPTDALMGQGVVILDLAAGFSAQPADITRPGLGSATTGHEDPEACQQA